MSKAKEAKDIIAATGISVVLLGIFAGSMLASAAPSPAPSPSHAVTSSVHSMTAGSGVVSVEDSGGRLKK